MRWLDKLRLWLRSVFRRSRLDKELEREVGFHFHQQIAENIAAGMNAEDARFAALRTFGDPTRIQEQCRDARGVNLIDETVQDVRYALRMLMKHPAFTAIAVLTLALGIGATTAIFSVVYALLLKPLPYRDSDRLVQLVVNVPAADVPSGTPIRATGSMSVAELTELQPRTRTLSHVGLYAPTLVTLSGGDEAARLQGAQVQPPILEMLGARPMLGRLLARDDDLSVILSYHAWRRYLAGRANALGETLTLDGKPYSVIGVMAQEFQFPDPRTEFWIPLVLEPTQQPDRVGRAPMMARLADGVSIQAAAAEVDSILRERRGWRYELVRAQDALVAPVKRALLVLTVAVGFVLLIGCVNLASLLLARMSTRQREIAIRVALGAGRARVVRLLLTESVMLAVLGGAAGTVLAFGGIRLLSTLATTLSRVDMGLFVPFPRLNEIGLHPPVFAFSVVASLITGVLFGLGPSVHYARFDCTYALKGGAESIVPSFNRVRRTNALGLLVTVQVGMAMMLLVGGGLLIHSFIRLSNVHLGYEPANVLTFQVALSGDRTPVVQLKVFAEEVTARLRSLPAVQAAAYTYQLPTVAIRRNAMFRRTPDLPKQRSLLPERGASAHLVSRDYFQVMGIRLNAGRWFGERDGADQPRVVVINKELARLTFGGENPIGTIVYVGPDRDPWQIVGIVDDVRQGRLDQNPEPQVFVDFRQWPGVDNPLFDAPQYFAVRTHGDPTLVVSDVRGLIRQVDARAGLFNVATMEQLVSNSVSRPRMYAVLLGVFAGVAVMLAVIGIYGIMTYAVAQRTREIGIRVALGARSSEVLHLVLRRGLALTAAGIVLGLMGAAAVTRYLARMLFGLTPLDATTFLTVSLMFAVVATLASYVPARRATKVDPLIAIRTE